MLQPILVDVEITMFGETITPGVKKLLDTTVGSEVSYEGNKLRFQVRFEQFNSNEAKSLLEKYLSMQVEQRVIKSFKFIDPKTDTKHYHKQREHKRQNKTKRKK